MEPFSITCTTCQARLRVRDASAIGQILGCPKCGSMVMVQPPPGYEAPPPQSDAPQSATPANATPTNATPDHATPDHATPPENTPAKARPAPTLDPTIPQSTPDTSRPPRKFKFKQGFTTPVQEAVPTAAAETRGPQPIQPQRSASITIATPSPPSVQERVESAEADPARLNWVQWALVGAAALFGVGLALLIVILGASPKSDEPEEPPAPIAVAADGPSHPAVEADAPSADARPEEPHTAGNTEPVHSDGTIADASAAAIDDGPPQVSAGGTALTPTEPPTMDTPPAESATAAAAPVDENATDTEPPVVPTDTAPASPAADTTPSTELDATHADPNSPLALTVAGAEFDGVALLDFLQFFSEYTAIPVTVDFDAMRRAGLSHDAQVSLQLEATTAGQLLQNALAPVDLSFTFANGQITIGPAVDVDSTIQTRSYDVSDLAETPERTASLTTLITAAIEPASWQEAGGLGVLALNDQSLDVEQTMAVHFELARLLDRLRTARGLLPRSELPRELLTNLPVFAPLEETLHKHLTLNFSDPTDIATILDRLRNEAEVRLLVDWDSTREADWRPDTKTTLSATDTAFVQLLDAWLAPKQLEFRVVDDHLIQIASLAALTARSEVEVYQLTESATKSGETVVQGLRQELGEPAISAVGGAAVIEPTSRCLVVRLPQPLQRHAYDWLSSHGHLEPAK